MSTEDMNSEDTGNEAKTGDFEAEHDKLLESIMALPEAARSVKLLSAAKAAVILDCSVVTLERRRKSKLPPPPAPNHIGGKKGNEVKYLASTLVEYIRGLPISQPAIYPETPNPSAISEGAAENATEPPKKNDPSVLAKNAAASTKKALAQTGAQRHLHKYCNGLAVEEEAALMPFFVSPQGLVLSPCWDEPAAMFESYWDDSTDVKWKAWPDALAAVWQDESARQGWLKTADQLAPGLRQRAEAIRHKILSSI